MFCKQQLQKFFSFFVSAAFACGGSLLHAATPSVGTVTPTAGSSVAWTGQATAATNGESTCVDGTTCDVFILDLSGTTAQYAGKYITVSATWGIQQEEYDIYVHKGGISGPVVASGTVGPLVGSQTASFSPGFTGAGIYTVHLVASVVTPNDPFNAVASVSNTPPAPPQARFTPPSYQNVHSPSNLGNRSGEPSIGVNWKSGNIMTNATTDTLRVSFDTRTSPATPAWLLVNSPVTSTTTLDPILFTDSVTGRTFVSQLAGPGSLSVYTDDDGATYTPIQGAGFASGVDHQTVGGGPFKTCTPQQASLNPGPCGILTARGPLTSYPHAVYYASQDIADGQIALSQDGGVTFEAAHPMYELTQCGGLHGHVKVGYDGTVFIPNKNCSGQQGLVVSNDNGLTFTVQGVTGSTPGASDPSVGIGAKGRIYFGYTDANSHARIAVSDDNGQSWNYNQDVGAKFNIQNSFAPEVVAGDNDRAAFFFIGTPAAGPGTGDDTTTIFSGVWHAYIATTIDGGKSWLTVDATPTDAVQLGVVCTNGTTCPAGTRNLLDFNDVSIDKQGRVYAAYTDGCISAACIAAGNSATADHTKAANDGGTKATILRQATGKSLFSAYDQTPLKP